MTSIGKSADHIKTLSQQVPRAADKLTNKLLQLTGDSKITKQTLSHNNYLMRNFISSYC